MLKARIIPTLLLTRLGLVKGVGFNSWRKVGSVLPAIKIYNQREVDELILLDIEAGLEKYGFDIDLMEEFCHESFVPLSVGGGITNIEQVQMLLRSGADKVCVNSAAYQFPGLITDIAKRYGTQSIVVSIDVRHNISQSGWQCFKNSGRVPTGHDVRSWAREVEDRGAGEILITSIERDGTFQGYDLPLVEAVVQSVKIPVIASGGAGTYKHMVDAVKEAGASAVAAASIFQFTQNTPAGAKAAMEQAGITVRRNYKGAGC